MEELKKDINNEELAQDDDSIIKVVEEANVLLSQKDKEIKELKTQLARAKLYKTVDDEPKEEPYDFNRKFSPRDRDIDFAIHAVKVHEYEMAHPESVKIDPKTGNRLYTLGARAQDVYEFLKHCIDQSGGDPIAFHNIYKASLGPDDKESLRLYNQAIQEIQQNNIKYNIN